MVKQKRGYKRGYPVALLIGLEKEQAVVWKVFSNVVKLIFTLKMKGSRSDARVLYSFHESVVVALRPLLKEGTKSIVVLSPIKTTYAADFLNHVRKHHSYLIQTNMPNRATFAQLVGSAGQPSEVAEILKTREFRSLIAETTSEEVDNIVNELERHLYGVNSKVIVLFSLREIEDNVYERVRAPKAYEREYLLLTDKYLAESKVRNRIHRLLQISNNKKVETRIVNAETPAGGRISQFGGIVFFRIPAK